MRLRFRWALAACLLGFAACQSTPAPIDGVTLVFITESDPGVPLSEVSIWVDGVLVGTSVGGRADFHLGSASARIVRVRHDCPAGHRDPVEDSLLQVRPFEELGATRARGLEVTLRCPPQEHIAAIVVRTTNAPSLPVLVNGTQVAHTNQYGVAHFRSRGAPGTEFAVRLDTSSDARLVPQHPTRVFTLDDQHQLFVVDQAFELDSEPLRKRRRRPRITKIE